VVCWKDINGLISWFGVDYNTSDWKIFIDSWHSSLKDVGLHNGNVFASIPGAHSVHMGETYYGLKLLLNSVNYKAPRCLCVWGLVSSWFLAWSTDRLHQDATFFV
jgi:hypothetical protein